MLYTSVESRSVKMEKHWFIFSGSLGRQCWDRAIIYRSLKEKEIRVQVKRRARRGMKVEY